VQKQSFGKFYKWAVEIAEGLSERKDAIQAKREVLDNLLVSFENGRNASQVLEGHFIDKEKKTALNAKKEASGAKNSLSGKAKASAKKTKKK
jgi:hypothetical protein